jgi:hypothetical protein
MTRPLLPWAVSALILAAFALWLLSGAGLAPLPPSPLRLWYGDPWGAEGSGHLLDWYSPSHLIHGILFYATLWLLLPRLAVAWRFVIALLVEVAWEVVENSPLVIERYRAVTASKDYAGDTVVNAVMDVLCMAVGFWLARRIPVWASVAVVVALEAFTTWAIRDGLALNVLMLLWPVDAVRDWQMGAQG